MQKSLFCCLTVVLTTHASAEAYAQEKGQFGLTIAYPASIGVVWHVTERVAIRPDFDFSSASTETSLPDVIPLPGLTLGERESTLSTVATGVSALFYLSKSDGLSTYVGPGFAYSWISYDNSFSVVELGEPSSSSYTLGGFFGAQYTPVRRFSVFGEVGIAGTSGRTTFDFNLSSETSIIGLRAGLGIVLFFK